MAEPSPPPPPSMVSMPTPASLAAVAGSLYTEGPRVLRALQHYRPYICPFHRLIGCVPAGPAPGPSVLDIGCGGGLFLMLLAMAARVGRGVGLDAAGPAIA